MGNKPIKIIIISSNGIELNISRNVGNELSVV